jgi:hypothetical protein
MQQHTRHIFRFSTIALGLVLLVAATVFAQSKDPGMGKWKLNVKKSTYEPGPVPKSEIRVYEVWEKDGVKATITTVGDDDKSATRSYMAHYDGKDSTYFGTPDYDTVALKRVDPNTIEATQKKRGKVVATTRTVISADGKTRTVTTVGVNAKKQKINNVAVFDRQ